MSKIKAFLKSHSTYAVRRAVRDLLQEGRMAARHLLATRKAANYSRVRPLRLNLGCGPNCRRGWLNIDLFDAAADLQLDLRKHWPFADNSVAYIYSEHAFEHFEFSEEVPHFLGESLRVLCEGGIFDVGVPDTEWLLQAYGNPNHEYWLHSLTWHPPSCETQLDHINYHFRQVEQHKYAWDERTLRRSLQRAGFTAIVRREFDPALDTGSRKLGTLYMRAAKPGPNESTH